MVHELHEVYELRALDGGGFEVRTRHPGWTHDTVVTAHALHTQRGHADWLVTQRHAADVLVVRANQPMLHHQLRRLPWPDIPTRDDTATAATAGPSSAASRSPPSPAWISHATQAFRITRRVAVSRDMMWRPAVTIGPVPDDASRRCHVHE